MRSVEDMLASVETATDGAAARPWPLVKTPAKPLLEDFPVAAREGAKAQRVYFKIVLKRHLMRLDDAAFVGSAYKSILDRQADTMGMVFFLDALRNGKLSKEQIIDGFVSSEEGMKAGIVVLDPLRIRRFFEATGSNLWDLIPSPLGFVRRWIPKSLAGGSR